MVKRHFDPRHKRRQVAIKQLFAQGFTPQKTLGELAINVLAHKQKEIDPKIAQAAPTWPINQINKIDLAILRLALYELLEGKQPLKVIINEAVELAKEFGSDASPSFVNGVLGKIVEEKEVK